MKSILQAAVAPFALLIACSVPVLALQHSVIGSPESMQAAHQLFTDPDESIDDIYIAAEPIQTVRIGVIGQQSTFQVTANGANVTGTLSVNKIPLRLANKAPTGPCAAPEFVLSPQGITTCNVHHRYVTAH